MGSYMLYGISVVEIRFSDQPYALSEAVDCCQRGRLLLKNIRALNLIFSAQHGAGLRFSSRSTGDAGAVETEEPG